MNGEIVPSSAGGDEAGVVLDRLEGQEASTETLLPSEPSVGQQLRAAREARGLTASEIAKMLKLSTYQVEALEADDWSRLPWNTIIRGFVRNYARLLNLNPTDLMAALDRHQMPPTQELEMPMGTNIRIPQGSIVERHDYVRVFAGFAVLGLAVLIYFFAPQTLWQKTWASFKGAAAPREAAVGKPARGAETQSPVSVIVPPTPIVLTNEVVVPNRSQKPILPESPAPVESRVAVPASLSPGNVLKFSFSQPSWVEVRDRTGEIVFSQLSQAGSQREIEGKPPFDLVIGNASQVTLQYKGKAIDLSKRSKDDVARLTLE